MMKSLVHKQKTMPLTYRYRLKMNKRLYDRFEAALYHTADIYNAALQERIEAYAHSRRQLQLGLVEKVRGPSKYDQYKSLTRLRKDKDYGSEFCHFATTMQRWAIERVDESFKGFYGRVNKEGGEKAGYPRFRAAKRLRAFGFTDYSGWSIKGKTLSMKGIGSVRLNAHREMPESVPKTLTVRRVGKRWFANIVFQVPIDVCRKRKVLGLDAGIVNLVALSDGTCIDNSRVGERYKDPIRHSQRALSRCKRGFKRREKVRQRLARLKEREANARLTYLHQVSAKVSDGCKVLCVEKLNTKKMVCNGGNYKKSLNRVLHDGALSKLRMLLTYKMKIKGGMCIEVDPRYTSQTCSACGCCDKANRKSRALFECVSCGFRANADVNAAINIKNKGVVVLGNVNVSH